MTIRYISIQFGTFALVGVLGCVLFGFGLAPLLVALLLSVLTVSAVAYVDARQGRYALHGENLFHQLTDEQLRECYDAYSTLEHGGMSRSLIFYKLITRYEDAADRGYENAASDLLEEISTRWSKLDDYNHTTLAG